VTRAAATASAFALAGFVILVGLGVWQLERKSWKENLIADLNAHTSAAPTSVPVAPDQARDEFARVRAAVQFVPDQDALVYTAGSALRPDIQGPGYWVLSPAHVGGRMIVVNRGFIPAQQKSSIPPPAGETEITGALRWPDEAGLFTPADDPQHNVWYRRDPVAIAKDKRWGAVPSFYIEQDAPQLSGAPKVGRLVVNLPDNHLQYAITWFGLAGALTAVYLVWLSGRTRKAKD
jgi:surfeit locus 1 family protein